MIWYSIVVSHWQCYQAADYLFEFQGSKHVHTHLMEV